MPNVRRTLFAVSDPVDNLVLEHLRPIRGEIAEIKTDLVEVKTRLGHMEGLYANLSGRVDRIAADVAHIKRRLDLVEA